MNRIKTDNSDSRFFLIADSQFDVRNVREALWWDN